MARFTSIVVGGRLRVVRDRLVELQHDAVLVGSLTNIRYLTGFTGSAGLAVVTRSGGILCVDGRYGQQATEQLTRAQCDLEVRVVRTASEMNEVIARYVASHSSVVFDATEFTLAQIEALGGVTPRMHRADGFIGVVRECKDDAELERISFAAACADTALASLESLLEGGKVTERDIRDELEYLMRKAGADGPSYDTIVASGPNAALPHHRPTDRRIVEGDTLVIDVGALVEGYHSDMTRTFLVGQCAPDLVEMYEAVREVQQSAVEMVRPGVECGSIDAWCRDEFTRRGHETLLAHSTGHGVGLVIHESPWLRAGVDAQLKPGQVVTVEPGLYRGGVGGVRIEDLLVVTQTGHTVLTNSPKESPCLQSPPTI